MVRPFECWFLGVIVNSISKKNTFDFSIWNSFSEKENLLFMVKIRCIRITFLWLYITILIALVSIIFTIVDLPSFSLALIAIFHTYMYLTRMVVFIFVKPNILLIFKTISFLEDVIFF